MIRIYNLISRNIFLVFLFVTGAGLFLKSNYGREIQGIDINVILLANGLLFVTSLAGLVMQEGSLKHQNPNAWIRMVMVSTFIKLIVLGAAALIYLSKAGAHKSKYAVFIAMGLYLLYTWFEVRISLRMNKKPNAGN